MGYVYLDSNATTQPVPQVLEAVRQAHEELWANPSSVHRFGQQVRAKVELARASVARLIHCRDRELVLTSGGTESNNLALRGVLAPGIGPAEGARVLITTRIEHSAIRQPAEDLVRSGVVVVYVPVDREGQVDPAVVAEALRVHGAPGGLVLVSIQWANNETGVVQAIADIGECCRAYCGEHGSVRVVFHTDATQAVGKVPVDVTQAPVDLLSFAAHKFHGPKGAGALYVRTGARLQPQTLGGPQERERRGGTENVPGIVGMGVAAELAAQFLDDSPWVARQRELRDRFEQGVLAAVPGTLVNSGGAKQRLWNTSNLGFPGLEAEAILLALSERGVCASAGAACSSGSLEPSPVLLAMGVPEPVAHGSLRFSLSRLTTEQEVDTALALVPGVVARLRQTLPLGT